jgi:hypothetical protein
MSEEFKMQPGVKVQWTQVTHRDNGSINFRNREGTVVEVLAGICRVKLSNGREALVDTEKLDDARLVSGITRMLFPDKAGKMKGEE